MRLDVDGMIAAASKGDAGLVFFNNPNNPTATVHGAKTVTDMVERIRKASAGHRHPDRRGVSRLRDRPVVSDGDSAGALDAQRLRRAHVLEGLRHGGHAHRLRDRHGRHDEAARAAEDAVQRQRLRRRRGDRVAQRSEAHRGRARAQHRRCARSPSRRLEDMGASPPTRRATSSSSTSAVRRRTSATPAPRPGVMVGRDFPPFEKTHCRISIGHDGRDEEGHRRVPRRAETDGTSGRRIQVRRRRKAGGSHADTTHIRPDRRQPAWPPLPDRRARPREQPVGRVRADARGGRAGRHLPLEQREPARPGPEGPRRRQGRVRPERRDARPLREPAGALIEAIAKKNGVKPENIVLGCGSTQILRSARTSSPRRTRRSSARSRPTRNAPATRR